MEYQKKEIRIFQNGRTVNDQFYIDGDYNVPEAKRDVGKIILSNGMLRVEEMKQVESYLKVSGKLEFKVLYMADEMVPVPASLEGRIPYWIGRTVPYEGQIECMGVMPGMYHQSELHLTDINVEPRMDENGEMRILGIEATLQVRLIVYEEEKIQILEDLYMLDHICIPEMKEKRFFRLKLQNHSKCRISEELTLPELKEDILQICHCKGKIQMETVKAETDGVHIDGVLHLRFLYVREDDQTPFGVWNGMVPFSYLLENGGGEPDMEDMDCTVEQLSVNLMGSGEVEVKAVLAFNCFQKEPVQIQNIESAEFRPMDTEELESRPGIVGYFVQQGDTLWNLAKKYNTTVENIKEVNHMEKEGINKGDKILIFKQNLGIL